MARITYTNGRGQSIVLGNSPPLLVTKLDGLGAVQNDIQSQQAPYQDGVTVIGATLQPRHLVIEGAILGQDRDFYRSQLLRVINPKQSGTLRYERGSLIREIACVPELAPAFPSNYQLPCQIFMLSLFCPDPFLLDPVTESKELADWLGGLSFVLRLPMMFAGRSSRVNHVVRNDGDVSTPLTIEFIGACLNPKIINVDTGEYIQVNAEIQPNEKLVITTHFGNKTVRLKNIVTNEDANAFHLLDLASTFFELKPGDSQLSYDADEGRGTTKVRVKWRNRYVGV